MPRSADELCAHLVPILQRELAAGNSVQYVDNAMLDSNSVLVMLSSFFKTDLPVQPPTQLIRVNDPHWWGAEYYCGGHGHQLVCPIEPLAFK